MKSNLKLKIVLSGQHRLIAFTTISPRSRSFLCPLYYTESPPRRGACENPIEMFVAHDVQRRSVFTFRISIESVCSVFFFLAAVPRFIDGAILPLVAYRYFFIFSSSSSSWRRDSFNLLHAVSRFYGRLRHNCISYYIFLFRFLAFFYSPQVFRAGDVNTRVKIFPVFIKGFCYLSHT